jgi:formiminotetrahydrofolate cyclodeaminase
VNESKKITKVMEKSGLLEMVYDPHKETNNLDSGLRALTNTINIIKSRISNEDSFINSMKKSANFSDQTEDLIDRLKQQVEDASLAFIGVSLWAHEERKKK